MQNYELTVVFDGKTTSAKKKTLLEKISGIIKALEGKIEKSEEWGVKPMTFQIKKSKEGLYTHMKVSIEAKNAPALNDKLRVEEEIIRFLLVRV